MVKWVQVGLMGAVLSGLGGVWAVAYGEIVVGAARALADDDVQAGIAQVLGLSMPLGAVADDGNGLSLEGGEIGVFVVINRGGHGIFEGPGVRGQYAIGLFSRGVARAADHLIGIDDVAVDPGLRSVAADPAKGGSDSVRTAQS